MPATKNGEPITLKSLLNIFAFSLASLVAFSSLFFGVNNLLAQKVDKIVYEKEQSLNSEQHKSILKQLKTHDRVILKLELMADLYLEKNRK